MPLPYLRWYTCAFVAQGQEVKYLSPAGFPGHVSYIPRIVVLSPHDISMFSPSWKNHLKISMRHKFPIFPYPLVNVYKKLWKITMLLRTVNQLFLWAIDSISFFYVYQRVRSPYLVSPSPSLDHEPGTVNPAAPSGPSAQRQSQAQATPCRRRGHGAAGGCCLEVGAGNGDSMEDIM